MSSHRELVNRYRDLRKKSIRLGNKLVESLGGESIVTVARRFGIMKRRELLLDTEDELSVVMDSAIHDYRIAGENAAQRYLRQHPPEEGTDEQLLLEALTRARYSLFESGNAERGVGMVLKDLLRGEETFVWDIAFSHTIQPGMMLASRLYSPGPITMTTGATLPVDEPTGAKLRPQLKPYVDGRTGLLKPLPPEELSKMSLLITGACIRSGAAESIRYAATDKLDRRAYDDLPGRTEPIHAPGKVGRNDPCPCGSGKKFKKCCGK